MAFLNALIVKLFVGLLGYVQARRDLKQTVWLEVEKQGLEHALNAENFKTESASRLDGGGAPVMSGRGGRIGKPIPPNDARL